MLENYYVKPESVDRIRASWLGEPIEKYVEWLNGRQYSTKSITNRVPILMQFGTFAQSKGCKTWSDLPSVEKSFVDYWVKEHGKNCKTARALGNVAKDARCPVQQLLGQIIPGYTGSGRNRQSCIPFIDRAPGFFPYLYEERGIRKITINRYSYFLRLLDTYLCRIGLHELSDITPLTLSTFITECSKNRHKSAMAALCSNLRIFLCYVHREHLTSRDLSLSIESPQFYRLADIPRFITWDEVQRMLDTVDRRTPVGRRDYAILLLLVTYGLRAREVALLTLDDIDWKGVRLRIPERKAGHSTAYPLSSMVGEAILDYIRNGRPKTTERYVFYRMLPPFAQLNWNTISGRASHYLHKAGIQVALAGSHTLRHTCVQRLVDAGL